MTIFDGFVVALDLDSCTNIKKKQEIKKLITDNNGQFTFVLNKQCNLLVTNAKENAENSYKCRLAIKNNIPVVSTDFLYDCISKGKALEVKHYKIVADASTQQFNKGIIFSQSNDENKHKISNILKVWKDGDQNMPQFDEGNYEVVEYECFLSTGEKQGKTFSVVELHASKINCDSKTNIFQSNNKLSFRISVQTGSTKQERNEENRVKREFRFTENSDLAMSAFLKLCQQALVGMIKVADLPHRDAGSKRLQMKLDTKRLLDQPEDVEVEELVEEIWKESVGCLEKMIQPSSLLLKLNQIEKAESILIQLKKSLNNKGGLEDLEQEFYAIIPHQNLAKERLDNKKSITRKLELCQLLRDLVSVSESTGSSTKSTTAKKYKALCCVIKSLRGEEFDAIRNTIMESILQSAKREVRIEKVFRIVRPIESLNFKSQFSNIKLMFHATKPENVLGILSRGLLLPRVVVDELGGSLTDVGRLGGGIYFADSISASMKYSESSKSSGSRFMFASSVALGACKDFLVEETTLSRAPPGFDSCHAVGKLRNDESAFEDDEYVIYSTDQQRLEYLVEFKLDGDPVIPRCSGFVSRVMADHGVSEMGALMEKLGEVSVSDILKVKDPLSSCKVGLLLKKSNISIPLKAVHVFVKMIDLVAEVTVLQQYLNTDSASDSEVKYVFPLDEDAVVHGFEAFINGKHVIGEVKEKERARAEYKEAVRRGHGAYLMDQDEQVQNLFVISVGNLPSAVEAVIKVTYVTQLSVEDGDICFNLPGCVAPWKEEDTLGVQTQDQTKTLKVKPSTLLKTDVQVSIEMPFEIRHISSPTHNIRIKKTDTKAVVEAARNQPLASGFKLLVKLTNVHVPRMWVEQHQQLDSRACMMTFYPEFDSTTLRNSEVVFLVDQSNSMYQSEAVVTARQILLLFLKELPDESLFNVVLFGSDFSKLFTWCKPKSEEAIEDANNFLKANSKSMGRSSICDLLHIFHLLTSPTITRNIIIITDGYLDDEFEVFRNVKDFLPKTRLFGIGVGPAANNHFLQNLARVGRGSHEYFDDNIKSKWIGKVKDMVSKASQPCVSEVAVEWRNFGNEEGIVQAPSHVSSIFSGSRQVIFGFVPNCTMATLKANIGGQEISTMVSTPELNITTGMMIHKLTAKAVIQDWLFGMMAQDKLEDEVMKRLKKNYIINLSIKHSIVTKYTSFVAIEERNKVEMQGELNINDLLAKNSVDFLPYLGWEPSPCKVKFICGGDSVVTVECPATSTTDDLLTLLSMNVSVGANFVLKDPFSKSTVDLKLFPQTVWECLVTFPEGFLCMPVEEFKEALVVSRGETSSELSHSRDDGEEKEEEEEEEEKEEEEKEEEEEDDDDDKDGDYAMRKEDTCLKFTCDFNMNKKQKLRFIEIPKGGDDQKNIHVCGSIPSNLVDHFLSGSISEKLHIEEVTLESREHDSGLSQEQQEGAITDVFPNVEEEEEEGRVEHLSRSHSVMEDSMALIQLEDSIDNLTGKTQHDFLVLPQQQEGAITDVFPNEEEEEEEEEERVERNLSCFYPVMEDSMALIQLEDSIDNLTVKRASRTAERSDFEIPIANDSLNPPPTSYLLQPLEDLVSCDCFFQELPAKLVQPSPPSAITDFREKEEELSSRVDEQPKAFGLFQSASFASVGGFSSTFESNRLGKEELSSRVDEQPKAFGLFQSASCKRSVRGFSRSSFGIKSGIARSESSHPELQSHGQELYQQGDHQQSFQQPLQLSCEKDQQTIKDITEALNKTPEIKDKLMTLLQKDEDSGYMFWELNEDLGALLRINSLLVKQLIISQFSHIYIESSGTMTDLARFFATLTTFALVLISHMSCGERNIQQLLKKIPLKQAQDLMAVYYFCTEMISKYLNFVKAFKHPLWEDILESTKEFIEF